MSQHMRFGTYSMATSESSGEFENMHSLTRDFSNYMLSMYLD